MHTSPREAKVKLTRWQYFFKTLYHNAAATSEFTYNYKVYSKDEELQQVDQKNQKLNLVMILLLVLLYMGTQKFQAVWMVIAYLIAVIIIQIVRFCSLPKDIMAHLQDTGRMEKI